MFGQPLIMPSSERVEEWEEILRLSAANSYLADVRLDPADNTPFEITDITRWVYRKTIPWVHPPSRLRGSWTDYIALGAGVLRDGRMFFILGRGVHSWTAGRRFFTRYAYRVIAMSPYFLAGWIKAKVQELRGDDLLGAGSRAEWYLEVAKALEKEGER